jgi:hypothetical protein
VSDEEALLRLLRAVRRRARLLAGLEGFALGLLGGASAVLLWTLGARVVARVEEQPWAFPTPGAAALLALGPAALWAILRATRAIDLGRCARETDHTAGEARRAGAATGTEAKGSVGARTSRNGDRVLAAWALVFAPRPRSRRAASWVRAALADARASTLELVPAQVVPLARPRRAGAALAATGLAALAVALPPTRAPAEPGPKSATAPAWDAGSGAWVQVPAISLGSAQAVAEELRARARELQDDPLARLADELEATLRLLPSTGGDPASLGATLERIAAQAAAEAEGGRAARDQIASTGQALAENGRTAEIGAAILRRDAEAARARLDALAGQMGALDAQARRKLSQALREAANAAALPSAPVAALGDDHGERPTVADAERRPEGPRRLDGTREERNEAEPGPKAGTSRTPREAERELRRLDRALEDAADKCREDPAACAESLRQVGQDAEQRIRESERGRARERLVDAARQVRERLEQRRRGDEGQEGHEKSESRFEQAAGSAADPGRATRSLRPASPAPAPESPPAGGAPPPRATAVATLAGQSGAATERAGTEPGDPPLGEATAALRGGRAEATHLRDGEGPDRATTIEAAATGGFRSSAYRHVFHDYEAAAEEALDATTVPPERRGLVRRYFQLIRPRH